MAWIEHRTNKQGEAWRVIWRQADLPGRQQQTFSTPADATGFQKMVEAAGDRWPPGWIPGRGPEEQQPSGAPLFRDYAERTIAARGRADERTKADYRRVLTNHINPVIGSTPVDLISRFDVAEVAQRMAAADLAPKTIANAHALLSSILNDAVTDRLIDRNPGVGAMPDLPDSRTEEMCFLTPGEFSVIARRVTGDTHQRLVRLLVGTGLRWSEATALQVHDVDLLGRRALDVRRAWKLRDGHYLLGAPKSNRSRRTVTLSPELVDLLVPLVSGKAPAEFVFQTPAAGPIRHNNFYNRVWAPAVFGAQHCDEHAPAAMDAWRRYRLDVRSAKRAGRDPSLLQPPPQSCGCPGALWKTPRIHDLRHTHVSWLIAAKVSLAAIQRRVGHESITTTINRYGHLAPEHAEEISAAIDSALALPAELAPFA